MMHVLNKGLLLCLLTCLGSLGSEIFHGKKVPEKKMLYMASLQNDAGKHICGGFLIHKNFVLSAAHCNKSTLTSVVLGTHNLLKVDNDTMRYRVKPCPHRDYEKKTHSNDIMLLKLEKKAQLNKRVKPVLLTKSENKIKNKTKCFVAGWGKTKNSGDFAKELQSVDVSVVNLETCQKQQKGPLPPNVICTGGKGADKGFCKGDSGGPLVCDGIAVGVVSFKYRDDCDYQLANVYTDISKYLGWINQILKSNSC